MKLLTHTRYATVASTAALVIALGGTSYAAVKITGSDIADGSVTTKDVKNKSLSLKDIESGHEGEAQGRSRLARSPGRQGRDRTRGTRREGRPVVRARPPSTTPTPTSPTRSAATTRA